MLPNFLLIGAPKSGTTALYNYLNQHPDIYMSPVKEPHFFAFEDEALSFQGPKVTINDTTITSLEAYQRLFQNAADETAVGEASALYLSIPKASERIKHYLPDAKLIAILRNPVDRAYASFMQLMRDGREPLRDFSQALQAEELRIQDNWGFLWRYQRLGLYAAQLHHYLDKFDRSQMKICLYDDFKANPVALLQDIFNFLTVDSSFIPDMSIKHNVSGIPRNPLLHAFLKRPNLVKELMKPFIPDQMRTQFVSSLRNRNLEKPELSSTVKHQLVNAFREDILELQTLLDRDLSAWLH